MADDKWGPTFDATAPAHEIARSVLTARLAAVARHLPLAVERARETPEHVHQLRVATRRAGAALRIFRELLPKKQTRRAKEVLRAVRRAAGGARDWDVFVETLAGSATLNGDGARPADDFLTGYASGEREAAQAHLVAASVDWEQPLHDLRDNLPGETRPDDAAPETFAALGEAALGELLTGFAAAVAADPSMPGELHQLRISAKRVRYAVEFFAGGLSPWLKEVLYPTVEKAQEVLGGVHDGYVAAARLNQILERLKHVRPETAKRVRPGFTAFARELRTHAKTSEREYRRWREEWAAIVAAPTFVALAKGEAIGDQRPREPSGKGGNGSPIPVGGGSVPPPVGPRGGPSRGKTSGASPSRPPRSRGGVQSAP